MRTAIFVPGEWYHCYNRGVEKRTIFHDIKDYERFLMSIYSCNSTTPIHISNVRKGYQGPTLVEILELPRGEQLVDIAAYALMPNHFHFLLREKVPGGTTSFMRKVCTGFAMYYNLKRERTGSLFQGKFKAKQVADDFYFRRLFNYIHANPAELYEPRWKSGIVVDEPALQKKLRLYRFSSLPDYLVGNRPESVLINPTLTSEYMEGPPALAEMFEEAKIFARENEPFPSTKVRP